MMMNQIEMELNEAAAEVEAEITHTIEEEEEYLSALGKAIAYWRSGRHIPLTLASELMAEGYAIDLLEAHYMKG